MPIDVIRESSDDPPYEIKGKETPVNGINPDTADMLMADWMNIQEDKPTQNNL